MMPKNGPDLMSAAPPVRAPASLDDDGEKWAYTTWEGSASGREVQGVRQEPEQGRGPPTYWEDSEPSDLGSASSRGSAVLRRVLASRVVCLFLEAVAFAAALAAVNLDSWVDMSESTAIDDWSDARLVVARTKWASAHSMRCGLWSVCLGDGVALLARTNPFWSGTGGYCSRRVAEFYRDEMFGDDHWYSIVAAQCIVVAYIMSSAARLCVSVALYVADTGRNDAGCWEPLALLRRELARVGSVAAVTQIVLGYVLMGIMIAVVKTVEEAAAASMGSDGDAGGDSFWLWLAVAVAAPLSAFVRSIADPSRRQTTEENNNEVECICDGQLQQGSMRPPACRAIPES